MEEEKKQLMSKSFGGASSGTEIVIVSDAVTPRDYSYGIMIKQTGSDDIPIYRPYTEITACLFALNQNSHHRQCIKR